MKEEWDRSISIVTDYGLDDHGVQHLPGTTIFLFFITSRPVLQTTQFPIPCTQGVMMTELTSHMYNLHGKLKYKNNFIFTLHIWGPYQKSWANSFHNKVKVWIWKHQILVKSVHCIHFFTKPHPNRCIFVTVLEVLKSPAAELYFSTQCTAMNNFLNCLLGHRSISLTNLNWS